MIEKLFNEKFLFTLRKLKNIQENCLLHLVTMVTQKKNITFLHVE